MLAISLFKKKVSILSLLLNGLFALVIFVGVSVLIDSYFWKYIVWPEGQVK